MARKIVHLVLCIVLIICCGIFLYQIFGMHFLLRRIDNADFVQGKYNGFIDERPYQRVAYDNLIHYILHPESRCKNSVTLGGKVMIDGKIDGDKVLCLAPGRGIQHGCLVYSFGINNEWSFDEAVNRKFGCKVHSFDPSMAKDDHEHSPNIWFYNMGIAEFNSKVKVENKTWIMKTFDAILKQLNHVNQTIDIIKMDIEGSEVAVLEDMLNKDLLKRVNHLCIELHLLQNPYWNKIFHLLKTIEGSGFRHFSTRNNTVMKPDRVPGLVGRREQHYFEMAWFRL